MKINKALLALFSTAMFSTAILIPTITQAAQIVTFQGEVSTQTCQASINGQTNGIVLLPTVSVSELNVKGSTAGLTPFSISVVGCATSNKESKITTKFLGRNVTSTGNLSNLATVSPATNVAIQLVHNSATITPITLNGITKVEGLTLLANQSAASYALAARYISEDGLAAAGAITAVAEYTVSYQ